MLASFSTIAGARLAQEQFRAIAATLAGCTPFIDGKFVNDHKECVTE
jgi:hypothetical protein